jgi:hypothetical protein
VTLSRRTPTPGPVERRAASRAACSTAQHHAGKGFDFSTVTEAEPDAVADELNARPRKRFEFATPTQQLSALLMH